MPRLPRAQIVLVAAAIAVAVGLISHYTSLRRATAALTAQLDAFGTAGRNPGAVRDVARATDRSTAGLMAARALLAEELDRRWLRALEPEARDRAAAQGEAKLELARDLALEALREQPASWHGLMILGGSRYLLASRRNEPRRWTERDAWARPLLAAIERAPAQPEPKRVLAAVYLSEWSIAAEAERREALVLVGDAFRDLNTLEQLLGVWLNRAASFEQALSVIPSDPRAWRQVEHFYRQREDWQRLARVLERLDRSMPADFDARLERARTMVEGGQRTSARQVLLSVLDEIPIRRVFAGHLSETIELLPPGPISERRSERLRAWLEWAADRTIVEECPFPPAVVERLTGLARADQPARRALDALMRGDLDAAIAVERRSFALEDRNWTTFLLLKAKVLADRGQDQAAARLLAEMSAPPELDVRRRAMRRRIASQGTVGDTGTVGGTGSAGDTGWFGHRNAYRREIATATPIETLNIRFRKVAAPGAVVEIRVNQGLAGFRAIESGSVLRIDLEPRANYVVVELFREAGGAFAPSEEI